jgi:hypothetical protein
LIDEKDLMHTDKASIIDITAFPEYQIFNAERKETDTGEEP